MKMITKKNFTLLIMILLASVCFGQTRQRVVVLPLENLAGPQHANDVTTLTELVINFINDTQRLTVIDRSALNAMMTAQKWQMDDWADNDKTAEMGKVLNAHYIVRGTVSTLGTNLVVQSRILDINTAEVRGSANEQLRNMNEAYDKLNTFAQNLTRSLGSGSTAQPTPPTPRPTTPTPAPAPAPAPGPTPSPSQWEEWKDKWFYLGPTLSYGLWSVPDPSLDDSLFILGIFDRVSTSLYGFGAVADLSLLRWLSITAGLTLGFDEYGFFPVVPLLVRMGGKPGPVEISGNVGYTLGVASGFTLGATLGFNVGRVGIMFFELGLIIPAFVTDPVIGELRGFMITLNAGMKWGMGNK